MSEARLDRSRRGVIGVVTLVVLAVALLITTGVTRAFGTDARLELNVGPLQDGAAPDTFWDSAVTDIPGLSLTAVHCHGFVRYEIQAGATGPPNSNACYAALGMYSGSTDDWGVYIALPGGAAVYRISENYQPWRYCVAGLSRDSPGPHTGPC